MIAALLAAASPTARPKPSVSVLPTPSGSPRVSWSSVSSPGDLLAMLPVDARLPVAVSVLAVLAWFALYGFVLLVTRPAPVTPGPPGQDLPGDEPPAVVSVLAADWSVTEDAAEATLLDLAARGYLELRQPDADPRHTTVHVTARSPVDAAAAAARQARVLRASAVAGPAGRPSGPAPLTPYEQQVLDHVMAIAVDGVVPLTALTFRDEGRAAPWAKTVESAVLADARDRGLIVRRVPGWWVTLLSVAGVVPSLAIGWLAVATDDKHDLGALTVGIFPFALFCGLAGRSRGHRGTRLGLQVA